MTETSAADPHPRRRVPVLDSEMAYVDTGQGRPVVLLHGNPTSSYLWRNVHPRGGRSAPLPGARPHRDGRIRAGARRLATGSRTTRGISTPGSRPWARRDIVLVGHDWGWRSGFHWAHRYPDRVGAWSTWRRWSGR